MTGITQLIGRILLALIFIWAGLGKLQDPAGTAGYMQGVGLPVILLWPTIVLEVVGGAMIAVGYQTRLAAYALAAFTLLTAVIFHSNFGDHMQTIMFLKNLAMAGGLLILATTEKTAYSLKD